MLIPIRHENMQGRRWPVITFTLIALNTLVFLSTHWTMDQQRPQRAEVRLHLLLLAAMHPELTVPENAQPFITEFAKENPEAWKQAASPNRDVIDAWDAHIRLVEDPAQLQQEMDDLGQRFQQEEDASLLEKYAFVPAHPKAINYITANFLHAGWLHLIGNMWFLWLSGFILEDTWGRIIYPVFYLIAGVAALQFYAWTNPGSFVAVLGASGCVAALMGAFLVRFPKLKIEMMWLLGIFRAYRFKASAYWLLPVWLLMEVLSGALFGKSSGVAHWAHVGGFLFGAVTALVIKHSGLETKANEVIESKIGWTADQEIVQATELLAQGKLDDAIAILRRYITSKPDAVDGYTLLQQAYWRKNNTAAFQEMTIRRCQLHLRQQDREAAWQDYEEFLHSGGQKLPAATWLELCRNLENGEAFDRAVSEYEKLADAYPNEKQSLLALLSAGRISLKKLGRPTEALRLYRAAQNSKIPHLEWDANIQQGIQEAEKAAAAEHPSALRS